MVNTSEVIEKRKPGRPKGVSLWTDAQLIRALQQSGGIISLAAKFLDNYPTQRIYTRIARSPTLKAALAEVMESRLDLAEGVVISKMKSGNLTAATFYLKHKGRHRGYKESVTTDLNVTINHEDALKELE